MFLRKSEKYYQPTSGNNNKVCPSGLTMFIFIVLVGIVFSSLSESESATIFNTTIHSPSLTGGNDGQFIINSKYKEEK